MTSCGGADPVTKPTADTTTTTAPTPAPAPSSRPTSPPTSPPTAEQPRQPVIPTAATKPGRLGAQAFVRYYVDLLNY
ncbi:MAG: hypothetical protein ACR2KL_13990, partial [Nocardioidaceae bacterium]